MAPVTDGLIGCDAGAYRIVAELGAGGMGTVYVGEHTLIGRKAAIKVLNADVSSHPEVVSRFFTEARAVNDIQHPNIVQVTDFGLLGSRHYIVMEYLEGETLADRLARQQGGDLGLLVRVGRQVASALGAVHDHGLVHRDLKPENIFLCQVPDYPDFVKLLDFGIAKLLGPDAQIGHRTQVGCIMGTPAYMSPEQCLGDARLDHRSDIYSLGIVLFEMAVGRLPFPGPTMGQLVVSHVGEPPPDPVSLNPVLPRRMADVILRALAKRPEQRFQSMRELREALENADDGRPEPVLCESAGPVQTVPLSPAARLAAIGSAPTVRLMKTPAAAQHGVAPMSCSLPAPVVRLAVGNTASATARPTPQPVSLHTEDAYAVLTGRLLELVRARTAAGTLPLPALWPVAAECLRELRRPGHGLAGATAILAQDPRLVRRLVALAGSPACPGRSRVTGLETAVVRLGDHRLQNALVEMTARGVLEPTTARVREAFPRAWAHSVAVAIIAERLARNLGREDLAAPVWLASVLHEVGKPLVVALLLEAEQRLAVSQRSVFLREETLVDIAEHTYAPVSQAVAQAWELPARTVAALDPDGDEAAGPISGAAIVRFADALANQLGWRTGNAPTERSPAIEAAVASGRARFGLADRSFEPLIAGLRERVTVLAPVLGA